MTKHNLKDSTIGWIGTGRMGFAMVKRLLQAGCDVRVYNRTKSKAEPLREYGARVVDTPAELADCDIVCTMVSGPGDLLSVVSEKLGVPLPVTECTRDMVQQSIDAGHTECDFGILLDMQARASGMELSPENISVDDGLS